jgi:hypothetical protein
LGQAASVIWLLLIASFGVGTVLEAAFWTGVGGRAKHSTE